MRMPFCFILVVCSLVTQTGCGQRKDPSVSESARPTHGWKTPWQSEKPLPKWVADPTEGGSRLAAYGSAEYRSSESRSEQRDRAMANARDELARMLRVRIRNAVRDYVADSGSSVTSFTDSVSQQVAEGTVSGTYQRDEWQNEKTNELYVWAVVDAKVAAKLAVEVAKAATASPHADAHIRAKLEADAGFAELERLLDAGSVNE